MEDSKMTKRNFAAKLISAVLALALCFSLSAPAFADAAAGVTQAKITKNLQMDEAVTTPTVTFSFTVDKVSLDDVTTDAEKAKMPDITIPAITYSNADTATPAAGSRLKEVKKTTDNFIPTIDKYPHAGIYKYTIKETAGSETGMTYSKAEYILEIYVENNPDYDPDTAGSQELVFGGIFSKTKDDEGNPADGKIDLAGDWFVNKFGKTSSLTISKAVTGAMGDKKKQFNFTLTLNTLSALEADTASYSGTITRAGGTTEAVTWTKSAALNFTLADGESLVFDNLPVGTVYSVSETNYAADGYTTTVESVTNGAEGTAEQNLVVGEDANSVAYTNKKDGTVPTGIVVDNLPFILLILVALGGLVGYVVLKRRKYRN